MSSKIASQPNNCEHCKPWETSLWRKLSISLIVCDHQGRIQWANPAYLQLSGTSLADLKERTFQPEFKILTRLSPLSPIESRCPFSDRPIRITTQPLEPDESGQVLFLMSIEDLSELYQARSQIQKSHARFRDVIEHVSDIYFIHDVMGNFSYIAPQFSQFFGYSVASRLGTWVGEIVHPDDLQPIEEMLANLIKTRIPHDNIELRIRHQDGHWVWCLASHSVILDDQGEIKGIQGFVRNIHDRKVAELALAQREQQFQDIMMNLHGVVYQYVIYPDGRDAFSYISPSWERLFGQDPAEPLAHSHAAWERLYLEDALRLKAMIDKSSSYLRAMDAEFRAKTVDNQEIWIELHAQPRSQENGEIWWDGIMVDVTARKSAEIALKNKTEELAETLQELQRTQTQMIQSEKMSSLGQLVAGIAHEINNPVNFIYGNLTYTEQYANDLLKVIETYQDALPVPSNALEKLLEEVDIDYLKIDLPKMVKSMQVGADRIREIVLSLRNFSRLDEAEFKAADLHTGIDSTLMILQNRLKAKDTRPEIQVQLDYGDRPEVDCYAGQLNQVFMNILSNAIDALEDDWEAGKITEPMIQVAIKTQGDRVVVSIQDNASGVPPEHLSRLFDPFYTTKPVGKGTGMGLSISYQIVVDRHGGQLECHSAIGAGTRFEIQLPIKH